MCGLDGMDAVGGDVVEIASQYDATTNTAHVEGQILFEMLSLMALSGAQQHNAFG